MMRNWAENEVELACKKENPDWDGESFDYGISVYKSALKAYNSLIEDGHSGFSWSLTAEVLYRLLKHRPLTPITDEDFYTAEPYINESQDFLDEHDMKSSIQCPRMSSLFRNEYNNGRVDYTDVDRYYCFDINNVDDTYSGGGAATILDELFPITMPYYPSTKRYAIACENFLVDANRGDFDTKAYHYIDTPDGDRVEVNKFFKEIDDGEPVTSMVEYEDFEVADNTENNGKVAVKKVIKSKSYTYQPTKWVEISKEEFYERKEHKIDTTYE